MAVTDSGITFPESTNAVEMPVGPVTYGQDLGIDSTGAVTTPEEPLKTYFGHSGQKATGAVPNPEPETFVQPGFEAKVVRAPHRREPSTSTAELKAQQRAQSERRQAQQSDNGFDGR